MLRHYRLEDFVWSPLFERNVTALLPQFDETSPLQRSNQALTGDAWQLGHLLCDFDNGPERLFPRINRFRGAPCFEVELDGFTQVCAGRFDVLALRSDTKLRTAGNVPVFFFCDKRAEAVSHTAMLLEKLK
jgi:hypothetical protein